MVPIGLEHERGVASKPSVGVVGASGADVMEEFAGEEEVEGVFAGLEELVVVDVGLPPVSCLVVEDFAAFVEGLVLGAPEDAIGMGVAGLEVVVDCSVVALEDLSVVIPMSRHGEGIGGEGAIEGGNPAVHVCR